MPAQGAGIHPESPAFSSRGPGGLPPIIGPAMAAAAPSPLLRTFVDDELLRAPLLFDQVLEGTFDELRRALPKLNPVQRTALADLTHELGRNKTGMREYFLRNLGEQVARELSRQTPPAAAPRAPSLQQAKTLSLVDEDEVAVEVELSHTIATIKSTAEYELRELQTFVAALVGDLDMSRDHNPFRADTWARALWAAAQALSGSRSHQVAFMRHATPPLAQLLRTSYAASTSRLEGMGVEPAAYRTMILPSGSRRGARSAESTYAPDLLRMRETMPAPLDTLSQPMAPRQPGQQGRPEHWTDVARGVTHKADRQAIELISRLFETMITDSRLAQDVALLISRLHGLAMRLALRDRSLLDHQKHPLWRFINQFAFAAEMSPSEHDPERLQLLRLVQGTIEQLTSEPEQHGNLYHWALERLEIFLNKRLSRRLALVATQVGALQKLEARLLGLAGPPATTTGALEHHQLDTVPAEFMDTVPPADVADDLAAAWLSKLRTGDWVRMYIQGRWAQAQLLWLGETREFLLFGDGASDDTWAVRAGAMRMMHAHKLAKTLKVRSIVGSAAARLQEQMAGNAATA